MKDTIQDHWSAEKFYFSNGLTSPNKNNKTIYFIYFFKKNNETSFALLAKIMYSMCCVNKTYKKTSLRVKLNRMDLILLTYIKWNFFGSFLLQQSVIEQRLIHAEVMPVKLHWAADVQMI